MIEKNINEELVKQEPAVKSLISMIFSIDKSEDMGFVSLYHRFPLYIDETGERSISTDILFVSRKFGMLIFKCVEYSDRTKLESEVISEDLNRIDRIIFAKILKDAPNLTKKRNLVFNIQSVIYLHNCHIKPQFEVWSEHEVVASENELKSVIAENKNQELSEYEFRDLKATIEGSKGIIKPIHRKLRDNDDLKNSKGAILTAIESDIYNFDIEQKRAALFTLDGAQRIRGLAGSGKTIILAMKAALIHLQNPNAEILYTYYTKSLQDLVKRLITRFYRQFAEKDPNWAKIHVMHAWGGYGLEGVYYNACNFNNIAPYKYADAKIKKPSDPFGVICEELNRYNLRKQYDYAILDEAQDFPIHFYRVCRQITKNNRIVWAYDDFQNILDIKIQDEKETFGKNEKGQYYIDFSKRSTDDLQDLILHRCYRNPRKVLVSAFALGLGIYNVDPKTGRSRIIQRLENNEQWENLGFLVEAGNSNTGDEMIISRPAENSPLLKNTYLDDNNVVIQVATFKDLNSECLEISKMIQEDIQKELKPEDITVISLDNRNAKAYFSVITRLLNQKGIKTFSLLDAPTDNITYKVPEHITLSTIYRAKGNESGSVYVIGIDAVFADKNNIVERNKLFTAMTRSLAWVTLTGQAPLANFCIDEFDKLKGNEFKLVFKQPSEKEVVTIRQNINKKQSVLNRIERMAEELAESGDLTKEEIVEVLKTKLSKKK